MASSSQTSYAVRIAVAGVTGYAGAELVRLLLTHPRIPSGSLLFLGRPGEDSATPLDHLHPQLTGLGPATTVVQSFSWRALEAFGAKLLFLATPHEQSREWVPLALDRGIRVVDLSGAWRLKQAAHRAVYQLSDADPEGAGRLQTEAVFGCPELHRGAIASSRLVANPGCYSTSIILALAPLLRAGAVDIECGIVCDSKSGVSGAGKTPTSKTHFMYAADNFSAYSVFGHRHTAELLEQLSLTPEQIQFTPHLLPIPRGILSTIYLRLSKSMESQEITDIFGSFYQDSPMVRLRARGVLPQIQHVVRTNFCDLGFEVGPGGRRLVLVSCLDNLLKGAASQAVQNMNLMLGWKEAEGLL